MMDKIEMRGPIRKRRPILVHGLMGACYSTARLWVRRNRPRMFNH